MVSVLTPSQNKVRIQMSIRLPRLLHSQGIIGMVDKNFHACDHNVKWIIMN